jgi:radical SAM-linked protein
MRVLLRFSKGGPARYISHLDLMRAMNRAILRAGIPAAWSQGFHPHIITAYAQALGLGYLSTGEYMEFELTQGEPAAAMDALNTVLPDGVRFTGAWPLADDAPTLMAKVAAARWSVRLSVPVNDALFTEFHGLLGKDKVEVVKQGKNGPATQDIRPGLLQIARDGDSLDLLLSAGSVLNIRPELVVRAVVDDPEVIAAITRTELYVNRGGALAPFYDICKEG